MEPDLHGLLPQALEVIYNVGPIAITLTENESQCKRMVDRFLAVGEGLMGVGQDQNFVDGTAIDSSGTRKEYPDLHGLLEVLRKGEALASQCKDMIIWTEKQRQVFQKIHEDLDTLKTQFDFEGYRDGLAKDCEIVSGSMSAGIDTEIKGDVSVAECLRIDPLDIQIGDEIGSGACAKVYKATWSGCTCAVKRFDSTYMSIGYIPELQKELDFLIQLRHPYMVQLMGLSVDSEHRCSIVMEIMSCSLRELIDSRLKTGKSVPFDIYEAVLILRKIAHGMRFVHSRGVVHRDLKAANVMVTERPGSIDVKIADFGESQFMDPSKTFGIAGTIAWMAPEILPRPLAARFQKPCNVDLESADVYSFAMTCYEVLTGEKPFSGSLNRNQYDDVRSGQLRPVRPMDSKLKGFIKACWDSDPKKRPNFETICYVLNQIRSKNSRVTTDSSSDVKRELVDLVQYRTQRTEDKEICFREKFESRKRRIRCLGTIPQNWDFWNSAKLGLMEFWSKLGKKRILIESKRESDELYYAMKVPEYLKIKHENLTTLGNIASASSAETVLAVSWLGCIFAAKLISGLGCDSSNYFLHVQREVNFLKELRHPHIVQLVGVSFHDRKFVIVMEMMSSDLKKLISHRVLRRRRWKSKGSDPVYKQTNETLCDKVVSDGPFDRLEAVLIIRKIALGMAFLHSRGVVHGNLKARNVMVNIEFSGSIDVKIADFGYSRGFRMYLTSPGVFEPSDPTDDFMVPDVLSMNGAESSNYERDLKAADVYCFAMTCYSIFAGESPISALGKGLESDWKSVSESMIKGARPTLPTDLHPDLKMLTEKCWHTDPLQRPNFTYICEELQRIQQAL